MGLIYALRQGDAVETMKSLPADSIDLLITDPAYESMEKHRKKGTSTRLKISKGSSNPWFEIFPDIRFPSFFTAAHRVLKPDSHLYVMCNFDTMQVIIPMGEAAGFKFWKPLVWDKVCIGMGYHYRARYEFILFFEKGKRRLNNLGIPDVLSFKRIKTKGAYPTEKPPELMEILIHQSTDEGQVVMDPFMGSGSVGVACGESNRHFLGSDLSTGSLDFARPRLVKATEVPWPS